MDKLSALSSSCTQPSREFVEAASSCHRCRSEMGVRGRLCVHCDLDEVRRRLVQVQA